MRERQTWIGVDLDGTLAYHASGQSVDHVGKPIPEMVTRVKNMLASGKRVKIMTARVCGDAGQEDLLEQQTMIRLWCVEHIGQELPVTCRKDYDMLELWDDRAVGMHRNTGEIVGGLHAYLDRRLSK